MVRSGKSLNQSFMQKGTAVLFSSWYSLYGNETTCGGKKEKNIILLLFFKLTLLPHEAPVRH